MELKDNMGMIWQLPELVWADVQAINKHLRLDPVALCLPKLVDGYATDLHSPQVQQWFLTWPGAPIAVGAILLSAQADAIKLDARGFATRWRGDAVDRLREAIWEAWIEYLPSQAREHSQTIRRSLEAQRAVQSDLLLQTITLLEEDGQVMVTESIQKLKDKLKERLVSRIAKKPSGDSPDSSESIPGHSAIVSST